MVAVYHMQMEYSKQMAILDHWRAGIFFALALAAIAYAASINSAGAYPELATLTQGVSSFKELSDKFTAIAQKKGGVYAYAVLRSAELPGGTDLHLLGHVVGDELYKQKGVEGIADCTQEFRNACSHTIVIGTLQEYGASEQALSLIDESCKQAPGGSGAYTMCYHGLGHGVFAYFGYDLEKTADFCRRMGTAAYHNEQYTQCVGGAIMELMGGGGHDPELWQAARGRYLTEDPLSPCNSGVVPEETKLFCYIYLTPELFVRAGTNLGRPDPGVFPQAFAFCDAVPEARDREACYGGFGKEFVPLAAARDIRGIDQMSDTAYQKVANWCMLAGAPDGKKACIEQALEAVFWGGENDPTASLRFCGVVPSSVQESCYGRLADNIQRYTAGERRMELCRELPPPFHAACTSGAPVDHE